MVKYLYEMMNHLLGVAMATMLTLSTFQKSSLESSNSNDANADKSVSSSISVVKLALINSSKLTLSSELMDANEDGLSFLDWLL